jgi:hypothetical protein
MGAKSSKKNIITVAEMSCIITDGDNLHNLIVQINEKSLKMCKCCHKVKVLAKKSTICIGCLNLKSIGKFRLREAGLTLSNLDDFTFAELYVKMTDSKIPVIGLTSIKEYQDLARLILK